MSLAQSIIFQVIALKIIESNIPHSCLKTCFLSLSYSKDEIQTSWFSMLGPLHCNPSVFPAFLPIILLHALYYPSTLNFSQAPVHLHLWIPSFYKWLCLCLECPTCSIYTSRQDFSQWAPPTWSLPWLGQTLSCSVILKHLIHVTTTTCIRLYANLPLLDCRILDVKDYLVHPVLSKPST